MTTEPLKEPFRTRAQLFLGDRLLANIRCRLSPPNAPVQGLALVPDDRDWLALGTLTLLLRSGKQYRIIPTRLEKAQGVPSLLRFDVSQ